MACDIANKQIKQINFLNAPRTAASSSYTAQEEDSDNNESDDTNAAVTKTISHLSCIRELTDYLLSYVKHHAVDKLIAINEFQNSAVHAIK